MPDTFTEARRQRARPAKTNLGAGRELPAGVERARPAWPARESCNIRNSGDHSDHQLAFKNIVDNSQSLVKQARPIADKVEPDLALVGTPVVSACESPAVACL